jgi:signal transduction histidine kinase
MRRGRMAQLGQLTATVAHEIRNPLGAVRTASFLIQRKIKDKDLGIEPQFQRIDNGISRCDAIITQLLDFSRSRALQLEEYVIDEWLARLVEEEAKSLPQIVAVDCNLGLRELSMPIDGGQLSRAVINLLSNASEAMVGKGEDASKFTTQTPRIIVETRQTGRGIEISVKDNGPGIAPDTLKKILEPLFTTKSFGTGLGLPAVEKVAQEHGGGLEVTSEEGKGACFILWFPIACNIREVA